MARFWVEFINRDVVESALTVDATTPFDAAQKASNGTVTYTPSSVAGIVRPRLGEPHSKVGPPLAYARRLPRSGRSQASKQTAYFGEL